ncbi:MAG TPA: Type 1 glutamine amidotransferase-like domain-containing protein [Acidimicrobiales bacterium]|nr:Type 1 glutamine amidotransferase-like domain-containing protein [Acidimicrobiales bacterium]
MTGSLALVGGAEWREGCSFDRDLLSASGADEVLVLPTGAAYEHPQRLVDAATAWFAGLGARVRPLMALDRVSASDPDHVAAAQAARFVYLAGSNPMHLRSVLVHSPLWDALVAAWNEGATLAGTSAGAMVLCDPAVDLRGGAFTLGMGLVPKMAVIPHADTWSEDKRHRTLQLAPKALPVVGIDERTALVRSPSGTWSAEGAGKVHVWVDATERDLDALP